MSALPDYIFAAKYGRYDEDLGRREVFDEAVDRVIDMHRQKYAGIDLEEELEFVRSAMKDKLVLGSQRALQFGGDPILRKEARIYNCVGEETQFVTANGVRSFSDFKDGDTVEVLTHEGRFVTATVRNYGKQDLHSITISRGKAEYVVRATRDHRWIRRDGSVTSSVQVGDTLLAAPQTFNDFAYESAEPDERMWWAYGYVYGDGTRVKGPEGDYKYSMVRLCGQDGHRFLARFQELGFKVSYPPSCSDDPMVYTGRYLKTTPNLKEDSPRLIRAFVAGYLDAAGYKNKNSNSPSRYIEIQTTGEDEIEFIREAFPIAGVYIVSEFDMTGQVTNYGVRDATINFRIIQGLGKTAAAWRVSAISNEVENEDVWCLDVPIDHSFVLPFGLVTGNCTVSYCDRPRFFQEALWLLLCGAGVGFSVQKHHIDKLPPVSKPSPALATFVIPDTIEGWADSLGVMLASYGLITDDMPEFEKFSRFVGTTVVFDYSLIRPAGSPLGSGSGKAPGPGPLRNAHEKIRELLNGVCTAGSAFVKWEEGKEDTRVKLRPIHAYDIIMHASDAVISGGVRRSATICIFSKDDEEMLRAKTGDWFRTNPQRGRSNNSALLLRGETSWEEFDQIVKSTREFGEPGFVWADSTEIVYNPCFHPDTRIMTERGQVRLRDLYATQEPNRVATDGRVTKTDTLNVDERGVVMRSATPVALTQRQASVFELVTEHGFRVKATANHIFPTIEGRKELKDLQPGDTLLLPSGKGSFGAEGSFDDGFVLGMMTGDGTFSDSRGHQHAFIDLWEDDFDISSWLGDLVADRAQHVKSRQNGGREPRRLDWCDQCPTGGDVKKKRIGGIRFNRWLERRLATDPQTLKRNVPECVWQGSEDIVRGYLSGLFFADGSVQASGSAKRETVSLRLTQANESLLREIQQLLMGFGVVSRLYPRREAGRRSLPDDKGGRSLYDCKAVFELVISRPNCVTFEREIGLKGRKGALLKAVLDARGRDCQKPERFITRVASVEFHSVSDVFCLTEPETNSVIADGVVAGQCVEIGMYPQLHGLTGWAFCNLCEVNAKICNSNLAKWGRAIRAAAILGTLQAGYTTFDYLGPLSTEIAEREALLGVSMTGIMDNPKYALDPELQRKHAALVLEVNEQVAAKIGINPTARATCVKPAGSTSCIMETASGIHAHHAKRYFRRAQANKMEEPLQYYYSHNPRSVEQSVWSANDTDMVITFCIETDDEALTKHDVGAVQLLEYVKLTQQNWVTAGKVEERCAQPWLSHNVSNTINVKENEWDQVGRFIYDNRHWFAGVSLLSHEGDLDYPQAPFVSVKDEQELVEVYGAGVFLASGLVVDGLHAFADNLWAACDCALGIGENLKDFKIPTGVPEEVKLAYKRVLAEKRDWVRRFNQFARRYFDGDLKKTSYCLKDVTLFKHWLDLRREHIPVDWSKMHEAENNVSFMHDSACAGGACQVGYA